FCLLSIRVLLGLTLFVLIWLLAIIVIIYKDLKLHKRDIVSKVSTIIYIFMGWICVVAAFPRYHSLGMSGVILSVAG
ncbi:hemolysin III family protein, partial [Enterococcus faecium]|uniref:hemolysin III family protein n=1 Tax=Enterococcus faecium TaxID=1352 RepID=UPI003907F5C9